MIVISDKLQQNRKIYKLQISKIFMTQLELRDFTPMAEDEKLVALPNIPEGNYASAWARAYNSEVNKRFNGNTNLIPSEDFSGMNTFKALLVDEMAQRVYNGTMRVALPRHLDDRVLALIRNKFYTTTPALVFRDSAEVWEGNKPLVRELTKHVEQAHGKIPKYALVTGLKVEPWPEDEAGYKLKVLPTTEFKVVESDALSPEFNQWYFSTTDENGIPNNLNREKQGKEDRQWFTSNQRVSWFGLYSDPGLDASGGRLACPLG